MKKMIEDIEEEREKALEEATDSLSELKIQEAQSRNKKEVEKQEIEPFSHEKKKLLCERMMNLSPSQLVGLLSLITSPVSVTSNFKYSYWV